MCALARGSGSRRWDGLESRDTAGPDDRTLGVLLGRVPLQETETSFRDKVTLPRPPLQLSAVVQAIDAAAHDARVRGLLCTFGGEPGWGSLAAAQELRDAIGRFRAAQHELPEAERRFTVAAADTFGESGQGTAAFYLASSCEKVRGTARLVGRGARRGA
jgi:hypothetical protein